MKRLGRRARKRRALERPRMHPLSRATRGPAMSGWRWWSTRGRLWLKDEVTGSRSHGCPFVGGAKGWSRAERDAGRSP